jgi:predicted RNase H-like nuclease
MMLAGIDGCREGWIAATLDGRNHTSVERHSSFDQALDGGYEVIVVDIPIGLPERGPRTCDLLARQLLGPPRASSVFPAPIRPMLAASSWKHACEIRRSIENKACSKQLANLLPKIKEVDALMSERLQSSVRECHPELAFATMNGGVPMRARKHSVDGRAERQALVSRHFGDAPGVIDQLVPRRLLTDALDAYACLFVARRVQLGTALILPRSPELDGRGLRAEIVT